MVGEVGRQSPSPRQPFTLAAMSIVEQYFPVERLWELYDYNPLTGLLISKRTGKSLSRKERKRGHSYGRVNFRINGACYAKSMQAVVWAWCTGAWPPAGLTVDHLDRNRTNNRIHNLRLATNREQAQNQSRFTGGARLRESGRYQARIWVDGKHRHLGDFATKAEAQQAYIKAMEGQPVKLP